MLNGFSLLVVEDDRDSREAIRETLEASGASVKTASSASEALAALAAREFDLVVSDLAMPDQSGFWLINKIRQVFHRRHVPVIAVTGHPFPSRVCGAPGSTTSCRSRPDPDRLCEAIAALLKASGATPHAPERSPA